MITGKNRIFSILAHPVDLVRTRQALTALRWFENWGGSIVTLPHTIAAASRCDRLTVRSGAAGAVNVIRRKPDSSLTEELPDETGFVTDGAPLGHCPVVHGTSPGMRDSDPLPVDPYHLDASMMVAEVIMIPEETTLLHLAAERGCATQTGKAMREGQRAAIFDYLAVPGDPQLPKERDHEIEG